MFVEIDSILITFVKLIDCLLNLNKTFNVLTLNCCGIRTKLNYSEFHELVNDLDVLCLVETKTDDLDEIIIPVFITKFKNRKPFANRKSEGIMLAFKKKIVKYINPLNTESSVVFMVQNFERITWVR